MYMYILYVYRRGYRLYIHIYENKVEHNQHAQLYKNKKKLKIQKLDNKKRKLENKI